MKKIIFVAFIFFFLFPKQAFAQNLKINEFLAHSSSGGMEWVEFYNPDQIDLSSFWMDDDADFNSDLGSSKKKSLSSLIKDNPVFPYIEMSSFLNNSGDNVVLFSETGEILDQFIYQEDPGTDVSIGRSPDGSSNFIVLENATKGLANSLPKPTLTPTPLPTNTPTPTLKPTPTSKPTPTVKPVSTNTPTPTLKPSPTSRVTITIQPSPTKSLAKTNLENVGRVLAQSTQSAANKVKEKSSLEKKEQAKTNFSTIFISFGLVILIACAILIVLKLRKIESK